jgi:hypothetical protein
MPEPWLKSLCDIPNINTKKIFMALCTEPYNNTNAADQFKYYCSLIKKYNLGGLYIWREDSPLTQEIVDILNSNLSLNPSLEKRE